MFYVKVKHKDMKRFEFYNGKGGSTRRKIHAARFDSREKADLVVADIIAANPGEWEAKIEPIPGT